jgi:hypothetical protein
VDKFGRVVKSFFQNIETRPVVLWYHYKFSFGNDQIFLDMYLFVPRTRIPELKKISSRKMLEHVSLSFNKRRHLKVCTRCGNDNVRMKPISYRMHGKVLRMFDV